MFFQSLVEITASKSTTIILSDPLITRGNIQANIQIQWVTILITKYLECKCMQYNQTITLYSSFSLPTYP